MNYVFRLPKFPVIFDSGERLFPARSKAQLERWIEKVEITDDTKRDIIDSNGEGFSYYPKINAITPSIGMRRWKKLPILDLYDSHRLPESQLIRRTSLGSRTLKDIVEEVVELLQQSPNAK